MFVAEALLNADTNADEGKLAPRFNALVRKETLAEIAAEISLGAVLRLGLSEIRSGGRSKAAVLADALEALIAAVYLDGGHHCAGAFINRLWAKAIKEVAADARDAKTILQEWAQAKGYAPPLYEQTQYSGPAHAPEFIITARLENGESASGKGGTKRQAEQCAAQDFLDRINKLDQTNKLVRTNKLDQINKLDRINKND